MKQLLPRLSPFLCHFLLLFPFLILPSLLSAQPVIPGLAAHWTMNGNFNDAGGNGINGTNFGAVAAQNNFGVANSAMFFGNPTATVTAYATHPVNALLSFSGTQNFSISALINITSPMAHSGAIYDNNLNYGGPGFWYRMQSTVPELRFNYKNGSVGMLNLPLGSWVHVTAVRESGVLKLYLNGVLKASGSEGTLTPTYSYPGRIGSMFWAGFSPPEYNGHTGRMDELRVYNRALTASEILQLNSSLLPLKMGQFTAARKSNAVELNWQTLSESNTAFFEVERSRDGKQFESIGKLSAAGNSNTMRQYTFSDKAAGDVVSYYRIRMTDLDGTATLSRVVVVNTIQKLTAIKIYPNPVADNIQFQLQGKGGEKAEVEVYDVQGRKYYKAIHSLQEGVQTISLPALPLTPGHYYLKIVKEGVVEMSSFIKS